MMLRYNAMLAGGIMVAAWAIAIFFLRFRRKTQDRLFGFFAAAFFLLGLERIVIVGYASDGGAFVYLVRLCAFVLIIVGIVGKNRDRRPPPSG